MSSAQRDEMEDHERLRALVPITADDLSPTVSTFSHGKLLPEDYRTARSLSPKPRANEGPSSHSGSDVASSIFDQFDEGNEYLTDPTLVADSPGEPTNYDLKPPPPAVSLGNAEWLADRLYSIDHLNVIMRDAALSAKFANFISRHRPQLSPLVKRYRDIQKAKAAIEYANALAQDLPPLNSKSSPNGPAAIVDSKFELRSKKATELLTTDALPAYITHLLVQLVTECLVKEVTGNNAPVMREMVEGLAEVYCMTDPSLPDNPIVYASEEFYRTTQYGREYVIGRNCRFLQGPKTSSSTVSRLAQSMSNSTDTTELILNYRRDGTPFLNLLMTAPLYDNKGRVRYFLGCQIDVTNIVQGGRGLDSFQRLLTRARRDSHTSAKCHHGPLKALGELSQQFSKEEMDVVRQRGQGRADLGHTTPARPSTAARRYFGLDDVEEQSIWPPTQFAGSSGRLPGVYQNYMLVRPFPSLRVIFASAPLRSPGMLQSKLMDHIGGPQFVRDGVLDALTEGVSVTAKITWTTKSSNGGDDDSQQPRPRWLHCTPLFGSDEKVGVWMIVMLETDVTTPGSSILESVAFSSATVTESKPPLPVRSSKSPDLDTDSISSRRTLTPKYTSKQDKIGIARLYAQYLRESRIGHREGERAHGVTSRFTDDGISEF